ncbi:hypothetical protein [Marixanthomonas spongiae]|uniref:Outer membrane protein beta-barrel domain-containing protein n=1 Tax=Marixanthomonas spongiae TaxID=2174845 RepID=A0A2U0HZE4_9FLAO|nr:hypothetical protein [Marixanthomonas spongiae]PVW14217.1 hypothetical protein DDV96_10435 [Marixanthomonas spongiae]
MKRLLLLACLLTTIAVSAQQQYTVDGNTYTLQKEIEGPLTLLWNTIDNEYRYFLQKGNTITELKNTKVNGSYQEEYKEVLQQQTQNASLAVDGVNLTLPSLREFVISYNKKVDPSFTFEEKSIQLQTRLGAYVGVSNNVYYINPNNTILPSFGVDLELTDEVKLKRHALVFRFKQLLKNSDYDFSNSEISLNYRFKFIKSSAIDVFANVKVVAYSHASRDIIYTDSNGQEERITGSGGELQTPGAFGLGADIALGNGFLTLSYNDIVAIGLESNDEFPVDFTVGYKFNL